MSTFLKYKPSSKIIVMVLAIVTFWSLKAFSESGTQKAELSNDDIKLILDNAKNGDAGNQYIAGILYQRGEQLPQNLEKAAEWYAKAAEQGYPQAQLSMGMLYDAGAGVNQNNNLALDWYRKAAEQGLPDAQYNLAVMYDQGRGTERDYVEAAKWYERSARQGYTNAQVNLGGMYSEGDGVAQNFQQAYVWMSVAAESGNKSAEFKTKWLSHKMSEEELKKAQATVEVCLNSNLSICGS